MTYCRMSCLLIDWKRLTLTALQTKPVGQTVAARMQDLLQCVCEYWSNCASLLSCNSDMQT